MKNHNIFFSHLHGGKVREVEANLLATVTHCKYIAKQKVICCFKYIHLYVCTQLVLDCCGLEQEEEATVH